MKTLPSSQKRELRARAHKLGPVVMIGDDGLTPGVLAEIDRSLKSHELIKVRIFGAEREQREALMTEMCARSGALPVQHIGKVVVIYRRNPEPVERPVRRASRPLSAKGKEQGKARTPRRNAVSRAPASRSLSESAGRAKAPAARRGPRTSGARTRARSPR